MPSPKKQLNYSIKTFGCKVNTYDSALIQKNLDPQIMYNSDVHIVNTCAVTDNAVKEAQRWIRQYKKKHPEKRILVTGCAAQVETEKFLDLKEVDLIVANSHKSELPEILNSHKFLTHKSSQKAEVFKSSIFKKTAKEPMGHLENNHTRLFLKIQDGCDSFCTFCIIPFARGKSRSISPPQLVDTVNKYYNQGVREIVLTGVHIGDYQILDTQKGLASLLRILLKNTKIPRIRLSSLEPIELNEELLELFTSHRICPHFHLSIQSTQSEILKKMKRQYNSKDVENTLWQINKKFPNAFVGMDLISGFAGETQNQFEETYKQLKDLPWTKIHVFPYSPRRYTYAQKAYPAWPRSLVMKRASLIRNLSNDRLKTERKKQIGTIKAVLPFKIKKEEGISRDYWTVKWNPINKQKKISSEYTHEELSMRINLEENGYLYGEIL